MINQQQPGGEKHIRVTERVVGSIPHPEGPELDYLTYDGKRTAKHDDDVPHYENTCRVQRCAGRVLRTHVFLRAFDAVVIVVVIVILMVVMLAVIVLVVLGLAAVPASRAPVRCRFFFSSRRRHTRSDRDWSSDVCSSDLPCQFRTSPMTRRGSLERYESVGLPGYFLSVRLGSSSKGPVASTT